MRAEDEGEASLATMLVRAFVAAAEVAFTTHAADADSRRMLEATFAATAGSFDASGTPGSRLPACDHLDEVLSSGSGSGSLRELAAAFRAVEPFVTWRRRPDPHGTSLGAYEDGHANAIVVGLGGVWDRPDIFLGATLMAPHVRYPDHDHPPEEVYLVLAPGEFLQGSGGWFGVGNGGSFYNPPGIRHSMRSMDKPFLTFWALRSAAATSSVGGAAAHLSLGG